MNARIDEKYADVILKCGVNVQPGQPVLIRTELAQREFAAILTRRAYDLGARFVHVVYRDPRNDRARIDRGREEYLDFVPSFAQTTFKAYLDENWASISLLGSEDPDVFEGIDSAKLGRAQKAASIAAQEWLTRASANHIAWNVCLYPTARWAAKVLGGEEAWEERIWKDLVPILRLDADDPAAAWAKQGAELKRRAAHMNAAKFDRVRFTGPGTDLTLGMRADRLFLGGGGQAKDGRTFMANIPTEEIFSAPDCARADGTGPVHAPRRDHGDERRGGLAQVQGRRGRRRGSREERARPRSVSQGR